MRKPLHKYKIKPVPLVKPTGHHIYAYRNFRTNQVLYSLTYTLTDKALEQLPDLGANSTPPTIRRDSWRPFYSVVFPNTPINKLQCQDVYKKLLDYKFLHELYWEPPAELSKTFTEKQIENMERQLDRRGGAKKESVYDVVARRKWNMRVNHIMNQKTNSIADLAAILLEQEDASGEKRAKLVQDREAEISLMEQYAAQVKKGYFDTLLEKEQKNLEMLKDASVKKNRKEIIRAELKEVRRKRREMEYASDMVGLVETWKDFSPEQRYEQTRAALPHAPEHVRERFIDAKPAPKIEGRPATDETSAGDEASRTEETAVAEESHNMELMLEQDLQAILGEPYSQQSEWEKMREEGYSWDQIAFTAWATRQLGSKPELFPFIGELVENAPQISWQPQEIEAAPESQMKESNSVSPETTGSVSETRAAGEAETAASEEPAYNELGGVAPKTKKIEYRHYLPPFPLNFAPLNVDRKWLPPTSLLLQEIISRRKEPEFSMEGVTVYWDHPLDAEYAQMWPSDVDHQDLGRIDHGHPAPEEAYRPKVEFDDLTPSAESSFEPLEESAEDGKETTASEQAAEEAARRKKALRNIRDKALKAVDERFEIRAKVAKRHQMRILKEGLQTPVKNSRKRAKRKKMRNSIKREKQGLPKSRKEYYKKLVRKEIPRMQE